MNSKWFFYYIILFFFDSSFYSMTMWLRLASSSSSWTIGLFDFSKAPERPCKGDDDGSIGIITDDKAAHRTIIPEIRKAKANPSLIPILVASFIISWFGPFRHKVGLIWHNFVIWLGIASLACWSARVVKIARPIEAPICL